MWFVYMLRCADGSLYTGITTELERRLQEHNTSNRGARYTRSRRPVSLAWSMPCENRSAAVRKELNIKGKSRAAKEEICRQCSSN